MIIVIKIVMLFLIFCICTMLGIQKANMYDNRVNELKKIKNALEVIKSKIEFTYEPIKEIFTEISKIIYLNEDNIFQKSINLMDKHSLQESWNISINEEKKLNNDDKNTIKMFGKLLGKTDKAGQINEINVTSNLIDTLIQNAENEKNKNYKLFKTLGSVIGVGLCIILI